MSRAEPAVAHIGTIPTPERRAGRFSPQSDRGIVVFLAALSGLSAFGIDFVLPGLADIRSAFDLPADSTRVSLVITAYIFGLGSGQIFLGPFADRYGRKPTVLVGLGLYAGGALGSALAPTLEVMLAFRLIMGLGAASPRAMSLTIARDRFTGDAMTRAMAMVMMFFQLSPAVAPLVGQGIVSVGPWQGLFVVAAAVSLSVMLWTTAFEETLEPADRRPFTVGRISQGAKAVAGSRWAFGHGLVLMFEFSAFYVYLSSSELIFDDVFDRGDLFAVLFAASAVLQAAGNLVASRIVGQIGTVRFMSAIMIAYVTCAGALLALTLAGDGRPPFWWWIAFLWAVNVLHALVLTTANSLAMQPLAALAGTGSGLIGTMSMMGGSVLASWVASTIEGTATPLSAAYFGFGALAGVCLVWARSGTGDAGLEVT